MAKGGTLKAKLIVVTCDEAVRDVALCDKALIGNKASGLAKIGELGLPTTPWAVITTEVWKYFRREGKLPKNFAQNVKDIIAFLEKKTGDKFGDAARPLLVSVRSGAPVSMPGMMDTVLNVGMTKKIADAKEAEFRNDCYRRLCETFRKPEGGKIEEEPYAQLADAIIAVLRSWNSERAVAYRRENKIEESLGTAVLVQAMAFGNRDTNSGTGVVFSRNMLSGKRGIDGECLLCSQGEDIVSGVKTPKPLTMLKKHLPNMYGELERAVRKLEQYYDDIVEVEFTIEQGVLYLLQCRIAKRTPEVAMAFAVSQVEGGSWSKKIALERIKFRHLGGKMLQEKDVKKAKIFARGIPASSGVACGKLAVDMESVKKLRRSGDRVILVRPDTNPNDFEGMLKSAGIVTCVGGMTSHAAVVARDNGIPAVVGASGIQWGNDGLKNNGMFIPCGDLITIDGTTGNIFQGKIALVRTQPSPDARKFLEWCGEVAEVNDDRRITYAHVGGKLGWQKKRISVNELLNSFYLIEAMAQRAKGSSREEALDVLREKEHKRVASILAFYLTLAVAGELRNSGMIEDQSKTVQLALAKLADSYDVVRGGNHDRRNRQHRGVRSLCAKSLKGQTEFFKLAETVFQASGWSNGYGGSAWAKIANTVRRYITRQFNTSTFVDRVFDLRHNGNCLFDKHSIVSGATSEENLHTQLDVKKKAYRNVLNLYEALIGEHDAVSPAVLRELRAGERDGLWKVSKRRENETY